MPYKRKGDLTEAVRKYRTRKKGRITIVPDDTGFGEILKQYLGLEVTPESFS